MRDEIELEERWLDCVLWHAEEAVPTGNSGGSSLAKQRREQSAPKIRKSDPEHMARHGIEYRFWRCQPAIGIGGGLKSASHLGFEASRFSLLCPEAASTGSSSGCSLPPRLGFARAKAAPSSCTTFW